MAPLKCLVAGDIAADVPAALARVTAVHASKAGPFDMLLIAGSALTEQGDAAAELLALHLAAPANLPVYLADARATAELVGALPEGTSVRLLEPTADGACVATVEGGATVAWLPRGAGDAELDALKSAALTAGFMGADVLLSRDWPRGCEVGASQASLAQAEAAGVFVNSVFGDEHAAGAALAVSPRYHFAAGRGAFWQRAPYRNTAPIGNGAEYGAKRAKITRLVGLGAAGGSKDKNKKWLHAIKLDPICYMSREALAEEPAGTTDSPYELKVSAAAVGGGAAGGAATGTFRAIEAGYTAVPRGEGTGTFFFGQDAAGGGGKKRKRRRDDAAEDDSQNVGNTTLFVGGLPPDQTEASFRKGLEQFPGMLEAVAKVRLPDGRRFAFVEFEHHKAARSAKATLQGVSLGGHEIDCAWGKAGDDRGPRDSEGGDNAQRFPADSRTACWFCLACPQLEAHLLASIGTESYLALAKGGIVDDHALMVPIAHFSSAADASAACAAEMLGYKRAVAAMLAGKAGPPKVLLAFERCADTKGVYHMHQQLVPLEADAARRALADMQTKTRRYGYPLEAVADGAPLDLGGRYFYAELWEAGAAAPATRMLATVHGDARIPLSLGRDSVAQAIGKPERAHWKACVTDKAGEEGLVAQFKADFKAHDPTMR